MTNFGVNRDQERFEFLQNITSVLRDQFSHVGGRGDLRVLMARFACHSADVFDSVDGRTIQESVISASSGWTVVDYAFTNTLASIEGFAADKAEIETLLDGLIVELCKMSGCMELKRPG